MLWLIGFQCVAVLTRLRVKLHMYLTLCIHGWDLRSTFRNVNWCAFGERW